MNSLMVTLFVVGMVLTTPALADDVEDVKAAVHEFYVLLNSTDAADAKAYAQLYAAGNTIFTAGGGLLGRTTSLEEREKGFERRIRGGLRNNYNQPRHSEVEVYGGMFAVETSYTTGSSTSPKGTIMPHRNRATRIWIKQGGQWKIVHQHYSPMQPLQLGELAR
ncbi:MAG: nuclear transport factor 2 family protein [Acidobacteria bacterium]|nr:nuclear transport factor 2 family protein [Acidobacteriota bacterium]